MGTRANPHESGLVDRGSQWGGRRPKSRSEIALDMARSINPGLGECITLGATGRQMEFFANREPLVSTHELVVERDPEVGQTD